jgi:histidyl-tRNA synthetase
MHLDWAFESAAYEYCETPIFEDTDLFARGVGESTDIVQKEMFTFEDMGGRSLTLRPEGTASICRSYVEHGMHKLPQPVKLWYRGPFFRHEAPQAGRFRQFTQVGAEALGSDDPTLDAESILLLTDILGAVGIPGVRVHVSSLGDVATRQQYAEDLRVHLRAREGQLSDDVRQRLDANPLRAFDSSHEGTRAAVADAPRLLDRLSSEDAGHFAEVRALLDDAGLEYEVDATLVRGLDYYTRTVFEITSDELGAQNALGGGGRYDGLVEELGGPPTPGVGWAAGIERIELASDMGGGTPADSFTAPHVFIAIDGGDRRIAFGLCRALRLQHVRVEMEQAGRSLKGQLRYADRRLARWLVRVGADGISARDRETGADHDGLTREAVERLIGPAEAP